MKKAKGIKDKNGNGIKTKKIANAARAKSTIGPVEYEEDRGMNIRMKEQPFPSSAKPEKNKQK
jgi:hypothetical protein